MIDLIKFKKIIKKNNILNVSKFFVSSIENPFIQLLLSDVNFDQIYTFDDGTANISPKSIYHVKERKSILQKINAMILGIKFDQNYIKNNSVMHYTIFENFKNITDRTYFIPLFKDIKFNNADKYVKIFVGQPYEEFKVNKKLDINKILTTHSITKYFPHPRERGIISDVEYISSDLIFEDYVINLLELGYFVEVYTFFSTTALNLSSLKNVKVFSLKNGELYGSYSDLYDLFELNNIKVIELNDL